MCNSHLIIYFILIICFNISAEQSEELSRYQREKLALDKQIKILDLSDTHLCQIELNNTYNEMEYSKDLESSFKEYKEKWKSCKKNQKASADILKVFYYRHASKFKKLSTLEVNKVLDTLKPFQIERFRRNASAIVSDHKKYLVNRTRKVELSNCNWLVNTRFYNHFILLREDIYLLEDDFEKEQFVKKRDVKNLFERYQFSRRICKLAVQKYFNVTARLAMIYEEMWEIMYILDDDLKISESEFFNESYSNKLTGLDWKLRYHHIPVIDQMSPGVEGLLERLAPEQVTRELSLEELLTR